MSGAKKAPKKAIAHRSVVLVAAPWTLYNRPSVQIGALSAYLRREVAGLAVTGHHLFLPVAARLGFPIYQAISERSFLAEAPYAALMYPERREAITARFKRLAGRNKALADLDMGRMLEVLQAAS